MSWFNHVSQGLNQQQPHPIDGGRLAATDVLNSRLRGPAEGSPTMATHHWTGSTTPSPGDFPPAPQGVYSPPSLGNLSCAPPSAGRLREPEPISYVSLQEQRCVLSWFQGWNAAQRERFLQDLLGKAVPGKVCTLLDSLSTLEVPSALSLLKHTAREGMFGHVQTFNRCFSPFFCTSARLKTGYQTSTNASCACGVSGLSLGERRRGIISCIYWKSRTLFLWDTFTGA